MVRKQIFLEERQNEALRSLAAKTGKSEGALMREAVDMRLASEQGTDAQWEALLQRWMARHEPAGPRTWRRDDLYEERMARHGHDTR